MENQDSVPKTVLQCASLFKSAKTDNDRFASLFLVTKVIKGEYCNEASLKVLYDAIGFPFLDRLLRASEVPDDCPPSIYKSIALSIASVFCGVPEIVNSDSIRSIIPILLNIISMKDSEDEEDMDLMLVSDCYECLHSISRCQSGRDALLVMGASKYLMEIYVEENFRHDEALKLLHHLVVLEGSSVWNGNESLFSELIHRICGEFISESSEKKFEICKILALLLCNSPKGFSDQDLLKSSWPKELFLALEGILCSRVGTGHRDVALQLMARILELLGIEWGLSTSPNSHQFLLLLINLACVEVRMKLEDKTLEQALNSGDILVACYTVIELFISFMTSQSFLEFDQKQRDQAYCALKGAVSAILGLLLQVHQDGTDWESTALDKRVTFVCASVRILGAWLAEEASSMKKEVCAVLPLIMSLCWNMYRRRTAGDDQAIDMLRFMLPALCHLAAEDLSRQILVKQSLHQLLYDYLLQQWELFTKWLKQQPTLAADWLHAETQEQADRAEKARPDSEAAVILVCSVLMNLVVLEPLMCQQHAVFIQLLRFIMAQVPKLIKCQDFLILHGNLAVLGLLILRHHSWKYRQGDSTVFRYIKDTVSFLWDAHNSEDSSQQMAMVISLRYKKDWPDLAELWFLGMQSLSNLLTNMDWIVDFIVDSGWPQEMVKSLGRVSASAIDANTRTAYEDFLCCLVKAQPKVKQIIKESGGKQVCRTHSMRLLLAQLNADPVPLRTILWKQWNLPESVAQKTCDQFLLQFRQCPENLNVDLDQWRTLIWASALGRDYQNLAAEVYPVWKRLRYSYLRLDTAVVMMLRQLRHRYRIGLITNGPSRSQWEKIFHLDAEGLFDLILVSGDLTCEKPEPAIFHLACHQLNVSPDQCIMVGDRLDTDIAGGRTAGLAATVWIPLTDGAEVPLQTAPPDFILKHVLDLASLFGIIL